MLVTNSNKHINIHTTTPIHQRGKLSLIKIYFEHSGNWAADSFHYVALVLVKTWLQSLTFFLHLNTFKTLFNILKVFYVLCLVSTGFSSRSLHSWTDRQNKASHSYREPRPPSFLWNTNEHNVSYKVLLCFYSLQVQDNTYEKIREE